MLAASRRTHAAAPRAALPQVTLAFGDRIVARRRPPRQMLLLGEAAPDEFDRRVEHAGEHEAVGAGLSHGAILHAPSPSPRCRASSWSSSPAWRAWTFPGLCPSKDAASP